MLHGLKARLEAQLNLPGGTTTEAISEDLARAGLTEGIVWGDRANRMPLDALILRNPSLRWRLETMGVFEDLATGAPPLASTATMAEMAEDPAFGDPIAWLDAVAP